MKCPRCREPQLTTVQRHKIEIDFCPQCRGVWLDRGELEKVINLTMAEAVSESGGERRYNALPEPKPFNLWNLLRDLFDSDKGSDIRRPPVM